MAVDEKLFGKLFFDVPPYNDKNTYLGLKNEDPELVLKTANFEFIEPFAHNDTMFQWRETAVSSIRGFALKIQLFYNEGITIRYEDDNGNKVVAPMFTDRQTFLNKMTEISQILRENFQKEFANEVTLIQLALADRIWVWKTIKCSFVPDDEKPKFKVGDFVVNTIWKFPLKITKLDSGNGQLESVQADGINPKDILYLVPEETQLLYTQPKFKVGDRILYPTTEMGAQLSGSAQALIEKAKAERLGYLVVTNITFNKFANSEFDYWLGFQDLPNASIPFYEEECKLYDPIPEKIIQKGEFYLKDPNVWLATEDSKEGIGFQYILMEASRYFTASIFPNLNFISFTQSDLAYRKFGELSVSLHYNYISGFSFYLKKQALEIAELEIKNLGVAQAVAQRIILFLATVDVELSDEFTKIWELLENGIERGIIRADWRITPKGCEADPNKIISGQVKKFYELNKARIDKLDTKISCKIIQALVGLSEYESCGSPSSSSLPKAKTDLLSRISKLKI